MGSHAGRKIWRTGAVWRDGIYDIEILGPLKKNWKHVKITNTETGVLTYSEHSHRYISKHAKLVKEGV